MLTKTQYKIMQLFVGHITELFSIREVGKKLKMNHSLVHRSIRLLIDRYKLLTVNKQKYVSLNYRDHHDMLSYVEYARRNNVLQKLKNADLALFTEDVINKMNEECFIFILFGSTVEKNNPRDIDILLIVDNIKKVEQNEMFILNIASKYRLPFECHVISFESVYEMLAKRDEMNLMNQILNKHIILYGAELFYRLLKRGRA